jgi:hypothetical protein
VSATPRSPEEIWKPIAEAELATRGVTGGTGFGRSEGLRISKKVYAMLVNGELVVKLPKARVDDLVDAGVGRRFDPGHGRIMKEWLSVPPSASRRWKALVAEGKAFVGASPG